MDDAYLYGCGCFPILDFSFVGPRANTPASTTSSARTRCTIGDADGVHFAVWAPNAHRVSVVGDFNAWDGRVHPMRRLGPSGVWEIFVPGIARRHRYKFEIRSSATASCC